MDYTKLTPPGGYFLHIAVSAILIFVVACERDEDEEPPSEPEEPELLHHDYSAIDDEERVDLTAIVDDLEIELDVSDSELFSSCRAIFEDEDGDILAWPVAPEETAVTIFGCNPDGYLKFDDGRRAIAYEVPIEDEERATNLRLVLYDADGAVEWSQLMDRSHHTRNFAANYRGSFLTALDDRLICVGTRWNTTTQALCARFETGNAVFDDEMNFFAGVMPFAYGDALISADIDGITQRYPFTGVEMRHRSFPERGGRAGFYATDEERIFFVPSRGDAILSGWDLESLREIWRADLSDLPHGGYARTSPKDKLLLFVVDGTLFGLDTDTGEKRMAFAVDDDRPSIAFGDDEFYVLHRRLDDPPLLFAIDPDNGDLRWVARAPAGSLDIEYDDGAIMTRTVRTVRKVRPLDHD